LEEVSVEVGLVVGAEDLVEVGEEASAEALAEVGAEAGLDGVIPMLGAGLAMVCLMVILTGDTDLAMVQHRPMATTHDKGA